MHDSWKVYLIIWKRARGFLPQSTAELDGSLVTAGHAKGDENK
jgi:hypothetical protein